MPPLTKEGLEKIAKEERTALRRKRGEFINDLEVTLAAIRMSERAGFSDEAFCKFVRHVANNYGNLAELMGAILLRAQSAEKAIG